MKNQGMSSFQRTIKDYLEQVADMDTAFALKYNNSDKNIEGCCSYIVGEMQKLAQNGCYGATDDEVYGLAVHFYTEDDLTNPAQSVNCSVISNQVFDLTEEEKAEAKAEAIKQYQEEVLREMRIKNGSKKVCEKKEEKQLTLF